MEKIPKRFWEDAKWGRKHASYLLEKYPEMWVAIVNKKVVAAGKNIEKVRNTAQEETGVKHVLVRFVDGGSCIYNY
jgi:hypothetical protein